MIDFYLYLFIHLFVFNFRCECYDYLFDIAVQMKLHGLNPLCTPEDHELKYQQSNGSEKA